MTLTFARMVRPLSALLALCLAIAGPCPAVNAGADPIVSTLSGSGTAGFADGPHPSFLMPMGVTYDGQGRLYVSDAAAQRIRRVTRDGSVATIAGGGDIDATGSWVAGDYRDGQGSAARFNRPAGLAVRRDGYLYVADSLNHCIRRVSPTGVVSTYAGSPTQAAHVDGPLVTARFVKPTGLAVDAADNLYVADYSGIRRIDPSGNVATATGLGIMPYAVAVFDGPLGLTIFAGDKYGVVMRPAPEAFNDAREDRRFTPSRNPNDANALITQGARPIGIPGSLAALDSYTVVYTDPQTNAIRLLELLSGEAKVIAGQADDGASGDTGGYRDGVGLSAKVFAPMGIARAPGGGFVFADGGNRRIRALSAFARTDTWQSSNDAYPGIGANPSPDEYRIAYIGNSFIWYDTSWSDSIEGILQSNLERDKFWSSAHKHPRVIPAMRLSLQAMLAFAHTAAATGLYDSVVLNLNTGDVVAMFRLDEPGTTLPPDWAQQVRDGMAEMNRVLAAKHIGFLVVEHPLSFEVSPSETPLLYLLYDYLPETIQRANPATENEMARRFTLYTQMEQAVRQAGCPVLDLRQLFEANANSPQRIALFGSNDLHFTQYGRHLVGTAVAARLTQLAPWRHLHV